MRNLAQDLRLAARLLRRSPGFTIAAVVVLALGIAPNVVVFSITNALLIRPLLSSNPSELVGVYARDRERPGSYRPFSLEDLGDLRGASDVFERVAGFEMVVLGTTEGERTRRTFGTVVSADYFATLGATLALGRPFSPAEERPGQPPVVIVSHHHWQARGAGADILGRTVTINATSFTVVGVAHDGFTGTTAVVGPEFWLPAGASDLVRASHDAAAGTVAPGAARRLMAIARLRPGLPERAAGPLLSIVSARLEQARPVAYKNLELQVAPLPRLNTSVAPTGDGEVWAAVVFLMAMAGIVLLVASLNLANMFRARSASRQREAAIRLAIGGSRWLIVRPLLVEALMLAAAGGAAGLALGVAVTWLLAGSVTPLSQFGVRFDIVPDWRVVMATFAMAGLAAMTFGLGPALRLSHVEIVDDLHARGGAGSRAGRQGGGRSSRLLVVAQVGMSLALLTAGSLFLKGAWKAAAADLGFPLDRGVIISVDAGLARQDEARSRRILTEVLSRLRGLSDVEAASVASSVPLDAAAEGCLVKRATSSPGTVQAMATVTTIGTDYFRTLGLPLLRGREFSAAEESLPSGTRPAIVDASLAEQLWPGADPMGQQVVVEGADPGVPIEAMVVVGVVPSIKQALFDRHSANLYVPYGGTFRAAMTIHARSRRAGAEAESALLAEMQRQVRQADPELPILAAKTLRTHRDTSLYVWIAQAGARVFTSLAVVALVLAAIGLYGIRSFVVSARTKEMGIRMAIGATPGQTVRLIVGEGLRLAAIGVGAGVTLAVPVAWLLGGWVYGVSTFDPVALGGAALVMLAVLLLASYVPARRAATIDPLVALRHD